MAKLYRRNFNATFQHPPIEFARTPLQAWIVKNNLSNAVVARALGNNVRYMAYIVSGDRLPSVKLAKKIEEYTKGEVKAIDMLKLS